MEQGYDCTIEQHGDELHFVLESEVAAICALPDPPGIWIRRQNRLIFPVKFRKGAKENSPASQE